MSEKVQVKGVWGIWDFLVSVLFALLMYAWTWNKGNLVKEIIGGIPYDGTSRLELLSLGKWLFLFAFFLLRVCQKMMAVSQVCILGLYRFGSFRKWWSIHFWKMHLVNGLTFLTVYLIWGLLDQMDMEVGTAFVFFLHLNVCVSIVTVADWCGKSKVAPSILIVLEGFFYVLSVCCNFPWLACGMHTRSIFERADGFPVWILVAEVVLTGLCWVIVPILHDKGFSGG